MKSSKLVILVTLTFCLLASVLVILFVPQNKEQKIKPVVALSNLVFSKKEKSFDQNLPDTIDKSIKMLFFGDIMLDRNVKNKINKNGLDYLIASSTLNQLNLQKYNLIYANLEGAVTNFGNHYKPIYSKDRKSVV